MPMTLSACATAGAEPVTSAAATAASSMSRAAARLPCSPCARPSQRRAASRVGGCASGFRTSVSYIVHASDQRPSRSACFALSMQSLTAADSTAPTSTVCTRAFMKSEDATVRVAGKALFRQRFYLRAHVHGVMPRADRAEGRGGLAPGRSGGARVAERARDFSELPQQLGVEEVVLRPFCLVEGDAQSGDALVESAALALDPCAALECAGGGEVIPAVHRIGEGAPGPFLRQLETSHPKPQLRDVERGDTHYHRVIPPGGDRERPLQVLERIAEISDLRVQHPEIVEHQGERLGITRLLECGETIRVILGGEGELAPRICKNPAILLDHSEQARFAARARKRSRFFVIALGLFRVTAP